jgi:hypothetical protein
VGHVVEVDDDPIPVTGLKSERSFVAVPVSEIEHAISHPQRAAVWRHVIEPDRHERYRTVDAELKLDNRCTQNLCTLRQRFRVEQQ